CYLTIAPKDQFRPRRTFAFPSDSRALGRPGRQEPETTGRELLLLLGGGRRAGLPFGGAQGREQVGGARRRVLALLRLALLAHIPVLPHAPLPGDSGIRGHSAAMPITAGSPTPRLLSRRGSGARS